jgi:predicted alpha/beta superfamily hydrolase
MRPGFYIAVFLIFSAKLSAQTGTFVKSPVTSWGMVQRIPEFRSAYIGTRTIDILVPDEYPGHPTERYPVLYMHDGQMLFDSSETWNHQEWGVDEALKQYNKKTGKSCIVVGIHNAGQNRYAEYFPKKPFEMLSSQGKEKIALLAEKQESRRMGEDGPASDLYLQFLAKEVKPMVDEAFRTKKEAASTFICGSSMGGLISLYALCELPKIFGAAACLSTHWPGIFDDNQNPVPAAFLKYLSEKAPSSSAHRIYMDCGTAGLDSLYPKYHLQAEKILKSKGYSGNKMKSRIVKGANHSEQAWKARMPEVLEFLLGK